MNKGYYVYGIAQGVEDGKISSISGIDDIHNLFPIALEDIFIITSEVNPEEYSEDRINEGLEDTAWVEVKGKRHFYIINQLAKGRAFIPLKFCTVHLNKEHLKAYFLKHIDIIKETLNYLKDKEEWTLKVFCDRKKFAECNMEKERIELEKQIVSISKDTECLLKEKISELLEEKVTVKIIGIMEELWKELGKRASKVKIINDHSHKETERKEDIVLNSAILIYREKISELCDYISEFKVKYNLSCMQFELVGPWPYYNFGRFSAP